MAVDKSCLTMWLENNLSVISLLERRHILGLLFSDWSVSWLLPFPPTALGTPLQTPVRVHLRRALADHVGLCIPCFCSALCGAPYPSLQFMRVASHILDECQPAASRYSRRARVVISQQGSKALKNRLSWGRLCSPQISQTWGKVKDLYKKKKKKNAIFKFYT